MRVHDKRQLVALDEALHFKPLIGELVGNAAKRNHRRLVAGKLEKTAQQHGRVAECLARPRLDRGDDLVREVGIRARKVEQEFSAAHHHVSP